MKRKLKIVLIIVFLLAVSYYFTFELAIPFAAGTSIPPRWNNVPLGQKRSIVHEYLGDPVGGPQNSSWDIKGDQWRQNVKENTVFLNISYDTDSTAKRYRIGFVYRTWFGERTYYLKRDST